MALRVLHVIPSLARGGAERQLVHLIAGTASHQYEHVVCHLHPDDALGAELRRAGARVIGLGLVGKHPVAAAAWRLVSLIRAEQPGCVMTSLFDANVGSRLARLVCRRIPLVTWLHSPDYEPETVRAGRQSPRRVELLRRIDRTTIRLAGSRFVACSHFVADSARRRLGLGETPIPVIYNSVDPETLARQPDARARLRQQLGLPERAFVYIAVGRLDRPKGHAFLLEALRHVARSHPAVHVVFVGDGPAGADLRARAETLGVASRSHFLGIRSDVGACLEMADAFVFPSLFEGFPLAPLEAMAKGLPCVASRIGPLLEVIKDGENGLLVPAGDVAALVSAMALVLDQPTLAARLGAAGRVTIQQRFHRDVVLPQWEALWQSLARPDHATGSAPLAKSSRAAERVVRQ